MCESVTERIRRESVREGRVRVRERERGENGCERERERKRGECVLERGESVYVFC